MPAAVPVVPRCARGGWRRRATVAAAGFLAALVACHVVGDRVFGPFSDVPVLSDKLAVLAARREEVDTLFVGSSRVYNHLSPRAFDAELRAAGLPSCSFNLGVSAMRPPESFQTLDRALALRRPNQRLRRVVLELANVNPAQEPGERDTRRMTAWHRPGAAGWMLAAIILAYEWPWRKAGWFYEHSRLTARCFGHVGDARDALFGPSPATTTTTARVIGSEGLGADGDGFAPTSKEAKATDPSCCRFAADPAGYERALAALRAPPPASAWGQREPVNLLLRRELPRRVAALRARGIETILFLPPVTRPDDGLRALAAGGDLGGAPAFVFNDPDRYPELYRREVRADGEHLDEEGAVLFTRLLARKVVAWEKQMTTESAR